MGKPDKKAALKRLTKAREALAKSDPKDFEKRNREVIEAERGVRFGRVRGWDYED
jgi:hypothetical protein